VHGVQSTSTVKPGMGLPSLSSTLKVMQQSAGFAGDELAVNDTAPAKTNKSRREKIVLFILESSLIFKISFTGE
jgi:hypothetical protein